MFWSNLCLVQAVLLVCSCRSCQQKLSSLEQLLISCRSRHAHPRRMIVLTPLRFVSTSSKLPNVSLHPCCPFPRRPAFPRLRRRFSPVGGSRNECVGGGPQRIGQIEPVPGSGRTVAFVRGCFGETANISFVLCASAAVPGSWHSEGSGHLSAYARTGEPALISEGGLWLIKFGRFDRGRGDENGGR